MNAAPLAPHVHVAPRSDAILAADVRALFRLEGELHELPRDSDEQWRHALTSLAALTGAQVAMLGVFGSLVRGGGVIHRGLHFGWAGDRERRLFEAYLRDDQERMPDPTIRRIGSAMQAPVSTFNRAEVLPDREWYDDPHVQEYRRAARVDAFLHSVRVERDAGHVISLHRAWGERPFTERERALLDLFHRESRALRPRRTEEPLSPHLDRTLRALLRGCSEKAAADELGLSPHTVHEYVKALYRRYQVRSRGELLARFLDGGRAPTK